MKTILAMFLVTIAGVVAITLTALLVALFILGLWLMAMAAKEAVTEIKANNTAEGIVVFVFFFNLGLALVSLTLLPFLEFWPLLTNLHPSFQN